MKILQVIDLHYSEFIIIVDKIDNEEVKKIITTLNKPKNIYWKEQSI
jgi:hypothetical protein